MLTLERMVDKSAGGNLNHPKLQTVEQVYQCYFPVLYRPSTNCFVYYVDLDYRGVFPMAFRDTQFCSLELKSSDAEALDAYVASWNNDLSELLQTLGNDGYKISFTWVDKQTSWCLTLIPTERASYNKNKLLTSWSNNPFEAAWICGYKHYVLCKGGEWPTSTNEGRWG